MWHNLNLLFLIVHFYINNFSTFTLDNVHDHTVPVFGILVRNDCGVQSISVSCLVVLQDTSQTAIKFVAIVTKTMELHE